MTTSVMYAGMTSKSVGATLLRIYRGLWTTLRCYMRGVPRRDIDLYEPRESTLVEHLDLPGISFGSGSFRHELSRPALSRTETCFFLRMMESLGERQVVTTRHMLLPKGKICCSVFYERHILLTCKPHGTITYFI